MSGYWATGSENMATDPANTISIEITEANIGRLIKNRLIIYYSRFQALVILVASKQAPTAYHLVETGLTTEPGLARCSPFVMTRSS